MSGYAPSPPTFGGASPIRSGRQPPGSRSRSVPGIARLPSRKGTPAMLTVFGPSQPGRSSRRDFLRIGALGVGGLTLADVLRARAEGTARSEASQKSVIMVYLPGGPSHMDM